MTTDNEPISPLPSQLPDVDLPCRCNCNTNFRHGILWQEGDGSAVYSSNDGRWSHELVPWGLVRAALAKPVAPASLAAEQRPFRVGDLVTAQGCTFQGLTSGCGMLTGELTSLDASANGHPDLAAIRGTLCLRSTLRHAEPPSAKRPECDACGKESCVSKSGFETHKSGAGIVHLCAVCWETPTSGAAFNAKVLARRKQLASGSAGSVQREQCESGSPALNRTEKPATEPTEPGRPSRDPYAGCSDFLREGIVGAAMREHDAERLAAMTPKQRQAAEMLLRPARPKRFREAPGGLEAWSSPSWESDP